MVTVSYPLRIDERIMPLVDLRAKDEYVDKSTALRKLLYQGVEDYVLELYRDGRLSIGKVAEILGKTIYDIHRLLQKRRIKIKHTEEVYKKSRETAKKFF